MLQVINGGWIQLPEQFEEVSFADSPYSPLQSISVWIGNDRDWRAANVVANQYGSVVGVIHVNRHWDERCIDSVHHLIIRPDLALHNLTGNAPLAGEKEDDGLAGLGSLVLSRSVVVSPNDAVGGDVKTIPSVGERNNQGYTPEPYPQPDELASIES